jgi:uncharacterized protein
MAKDPAGAGIRRADETRLRGPDRLAAGYLGVGYKHQYFEEIRDTRPDIGFFEIHAENFMGAGGEPHARLEWLRRDYQIFIHGVGLSLGGGANLDKAHLERVRRLIDRYQPAIFSEHLAWSSHEGRYFNDLLPFPYAHETLLSVAANVQRVQDALGRRILIENPATYVQFTESTLDETAFLQELAQRTGCGLLLDITNAYISAANHGFPTENYLECFPLFAVEEIHLAGFHVDKAPGKETLLIDSCECRT